MGRRSQEIQHEHQAVLGRRKWSGCRGGDCFGGLDQGEDGDDDDVSCCCVKREVPNSLNMTILYRVGTGDGSAWEKCRDPSKHTIVR